MSNKKILALLLPIAATVRIWSAAAHSQEPEPWPVDEVLSAVMQSHSLQLMRDTCTNLFPAQASRIMDLYEASAVPEYVTAFEYERDFSGILGTRDESLRASGMSEAEASVHCFAEFPSLLNSFDDRYRGRSQSLLRVAEQLARSRIAEGRAQTQQESNNDLRIDNLILAISKASDLAYQTGDWSILARLYAPGTFDCWSDTDILRGYTHIAVPNIPSDATYEVRSFGQYIAGTIGAFTNVRPTHLLEVRFTTTHDWGRCGVEHKNLYPTLHFYLVERDGEFSLTHYCPKRHVDVDSVAGTMPSATRAATNLSRVDDDEWERIPQEIDGDPSSSAASYRLQRKYGFSHAEAMAIIHHICDPANNIQ